MRHPVWPFTVLALLVASCSTRSEGSEDPLRIAFGSCALQWEEQPIWDAVLAQEPDLFLFLGDAIYGDWDGEQVVPVTRESLLEQWQVLGDRPEFQRLRAAVPIHAVWDNHDYGKHDGGAEFELREESKEVFLDFFGEPEASQRRRTPGIYDGFVIGSGEKRVQVLLLDTRTFKSPFVHDVRSKEEKERLGVVGKYLPNFAPDATLLGEAQWAWLEDQLRLPARVRLVASSTQILPDQKGMDEWGNFPLERQRLFDLLERTGAAGVLFMSGNVHFAELSRVEGPYPLFEATSSGLTHVEPKYAGVPNPYRIGEPLVDLNFGLIEVLWDEDPSPLVRLALMDVDGSPVVVHEVALGDLRP